MPDSPDHPEVFLDRRSLVWSGLKLVRIKVDKERAHDYHCSRSDYDRPKHASHRQLYDSPAHDNDRDQHPPPKRQEDRVADLKGVLFHVSFRAFNPASKLARASLTDGRSDTSGTATSHQLPPCSVLG